MCDIVGRRPVSVTNAFISAMAARFAQHGVTQGVRTIHQRDWLTVIQALNDYAVVLDEGGRIALAQIGQHAKQVVRTD